MHVAHGSFDSKVSLGVSPMKENLKMHLPSKLIIITVKVTNYSCKRFCSSRSVYLIRLELISFLTTDMLILFQFVLISTVTIETPNLLKIKQDYLFWQLVLYLYVGYI